MTLGGIYFCFETLLSAGWKWALYYLLRYIQLASEGTVMVFGSDYCHGVGGRYTEWHTTVSLAVHKGNGKFILDMIRSGNLIPTPSLHHFLTVSHSIACLFPCVNSLQVEFWCLLSSSARWTSARVFQIAPSLASAANGVYFLVVFMLFYSSFFHSFLSFLSF